MMSNPVPENVPGVEPGEMVSVEVIGRLRTSVDGAVTIEVADAQEPVLRIPWSSVFQVGPSFLAPDAYESAAARTEVAS